MKIIICIMSARMVIQCLIGIGREKEIDWMAVHGINMPLALVGYEGIMYRVWKKWDLRMMKLCRAGSFALDGDGKCKWY